MEEAAGNVGFTSDNVVPIEKRQDISGSDTNRICQSDSELIGWGFGPISSSENVNQIYAKKRQKTA